MLLLVLIIGGAILIGLATGGSLQALLHIPLRLAWIAPVALLLQVVPLGRAAWVGVGALVISYVLLLTFIGANLRLSGAWLMLVGVAMNAVVIFSNSGMPVSADAIADSGQSSSLAALASDSDGFKHHQLDSQTLLPILADVIPLAPPLGMVVSIGDLVFYAGIGWVVVAAMRKREERPDPAVQPPASDSDQVAESASNRPAGASPPGT